MTTKSIDALLSIAMDMTASLSREDRSQRLVEAVLRVLPCDAATLLCWVAGELVPIAAHGTSDELFGKRFRLDDHPRLAAACASEGPLLFPADSPLPDPFDGLIGGDRGIELHVHSCLACPLRVDDELVGVLTADALQPGAFDAIPKEVLAHLAALAGASLRTGLMIEALEERAGRERLLMRDQLRDVSQRRGGLLLGRSEPMEALRRTIEMIAPSDFPVLVSGETGTGKELVARRLHARSARSEQPLVYVNCAALPESIAESELFGHVSGAFTGATETRLGKFSMADGATLFLDEIGELPLHIQPKLLRALQDGEIQRIGSDDVLHVNVRIIAATNRNLIDEVAAGRFRSDLLHRLDVCRIRVPALREHPADIMELAAAGADDARRHLGTGPIRFSADAKAALIRAEWPGNVRELQNVVSRAVLRANTRSAPGESVLIHRADCGGEIGESAGSFAGVPTSPENSLGASPAPSASLVRAELGERTLREALDDYRRQLIESACSEAAGNWAAAARKLGMNRSNLHHLVKRLGMT